MEKTLEQQALEWVKKRAELAERRNQSIMEGGPMISYKRSVIDPDSLPEPLKAEVQKLL
jgi:hypothetical protein